MSDDDIAGLRKHFDDKATAEVVFQVTDGVPAEARGKSFGIYYLANGLCVLAGTVLFGEIYQHVTPQAAFWVGAGLAVAGAGAVLVVPKRV